MVSILSGLAAGIANTHTYNSYGSIRIGDQTTHYSSSFSYTDRYAANKQGTELDNALQSKRVRKLRQQMNDLHCDSTVAVN